MLPKLSLHFSFVLLLAGAMIANFYMTHNKNAFRASEALSINLNDFYCASNLDELKTKDCMIGVEGSTESYVANTEECRAIY